MSQAVVSERGLPPDGSPDSVLSQGVLPSLLTSRRPWPWFLLVADGLGSLVAFTIGAAVRGPAFGVREGPTSIASSLVDELPYLPLLLLALACYGMYHRTRRRVRTTSFLDLGHLVHGLLAGAIAILVVSAVFRRWFGAPRLGWIEVIFMTVPALLLIPMARASSSFLLRSHGATHSRVVVLGSGSVAWSVIRRLQACPDVRVLGFVDDDIRVSENQPDVSCLGAIVDLPALCSRHRADRVLVAFSDANQERIEIVLRQLPPTVHVSVVPRLFELVTWQSHLEELHGLTVMDIPPAQLGAAQRFLKRALDVIVSGILLALLAGPLLVIAAAIRSTSRGPVLFRQWRSGRRAEPFSILKFRTMYVGADDSKIDLQSANEVDGPLFKMKRDPRVTPLGRFLRKTSLDELPQLINVLKGEMSLVGPRPFVLAESAGIDGWAARRFDVRPGMTGLWQVSGRNDLPFQELRQLDYAYVASWSLWWDLKILWHTPSSVLRSQGAY